MNLDLCPAGGSEKSSRLPAVQRIPQDLVADPRSIGHRLAEVDIADQWPVHAGEGLV